MTTTYLPIIALLSLIQRTHANNNNFCGMSWADASQDCESKQPCPTGSDDECILPGLICFADTMCTSEGLPPAPDPLASIVEVGREELSNRKFCGGWWAGAQETCSLDTYCGHDETACEEGMQCYDTQCHVQDLAEAEFGENWKEILMLSTPEEESSPESVKLDSDDPRRKNFCGKSWFDANDNCAIWCLGEDTDCPPGQGCWGDTGCFYDDDLVPTLMPTAGPPTTEAPVVMSDPINAQFCGEDWNKALDNCSPETHCLSDDDCPNGHLCVGFLPGCNLVEMQIAAKAKEEADMAEYNTTSTKQAMQLTPGAPENFSFCGSSWEDAMDNCSLDTHCPDSICPEEGQYCFQHIVLNDCNAYDFWLETIPPPTLSPTRFEESLRKDEEDASQNIAFGAMHDENDDEASEEKPELVLTQGAPENHWFCGKDWIDAVENCSMRTYCPDNECPEGTSCFHNILENDCDAYDFWLGSTPFPSASPIVSTESPTTYVTEELNTTSAANETGDLSTTLAMDNTGEVNSTSTESPSSAATNEPNTTSTESPSSAATNANSSSTESPSSAATKEPVSASSMIALEVTSAPSIAGTTTPTLHGLMPPPPPTVSPTTTQAHSHPPTAVPTLAPLPIVFGLCANDFYELHQTYRTATQCSSINPCPDDLTCFEAIDFAASAESPTSKPTRLRKSKAPSEQPSQLASSLSPNRAPQTDAPETSTPSANPTPVPTVSQEEETLAPTTLKFYCAVNVEELELSCGTAIECTGGMAACPEGLGCIHYQCDQPEEEESAPATPSEPQLLCASSWYELEASCAIAQSCNSGPCPSGMFCFPFTCDAAVAEGPASDITLNAAESDQESAVAEESPVSDVTPSINELGSHFCPTDYTGYHSQGGHNCKIYYECKEGEVIGEAHTCADDLKYDLIRQMCWYEDEVDSDCRGPPMTSEPTRYFTAKPTYYFDKSNKEYCPKDYVGSLSHKNFDCKLYYQCKNGEIVGDAQTCEDDLKYDIVRQMCWYGEEVNEFCYGPPMDTDASAPTPNPSFQPDLNSTIDENMAMFNDAIYACPESYTGWTVLNECTQYYWCDDGAFIGDLLYCEDDLLFDVNNETCRNSTEVQCSETASSDDYYLTSSSPASAHRSEYSWPGSNISETEEEDFPGTEQWKIAYFSPGVSWKSTKTALAWSSILVAANLIL